MLGVEKDKFRRNSCKTYSGVVSEMENAAAIIGML